MTRKRVRPEFSLPPKPPAAGQGSAPEGTRTEWVYRSDEPAADRSAALPDDAVRVRDESIEAAEQIVAKYSRYAAVAGLIPVPAVDLVAVGAVQVKMVAALAAHYGTRFNDRVGTSLVAALIGGAGTAQLGCGVGWWLVKTVPIVGGLAAVAATPGVAFALTYGVGQVFIMHFEAGGTLLDFDPRAMRGHFEREFTGASAPSVNAGS